MNLYQIITIFFSKYYIVYNIHDTQVFMSHCTFLKIGKILNYIFTMINSFAHSLNVTEYEIKTSYLMRLNDTLIMLQ